MADIRINALATTAASTASDDFVAVDGSANGTRKLNAYSPTFGGNLTVSGGTLAVTPSANDATATLKGRATGTNQLATSSRGSNVTLVNLDTTDNNCEAIAFQNSNELAIASIVAQNVSHTGRTGKLYVNISNGAAPAEALNIAADKTVTLAGNLTVSGGTITGGASGMSLASGGTNQNLSITPSGTGRVHIAKSAGQDSYIELAGNGNTAGTSSVVIGQSGADLGVLYNRKNAALSFGTNGTEVARFFANGNLFVGASPVDGGQKLQVNGDSGFLGHLEIPADKHIYMKQGNPLRWSADGLDTGTMRADIYADSGGILYFRTNGTTAALNIDASQNATFAGAITSSRPYQDISSGLSNIYVYSTDTAAQDKGGTIQLGGAYTGTTTTTFGGVRGSKESTTAGETGGQLEFFTRPNGGAMTRRAYIGSTGNATFAGTVTPTGGIVGVTTNSNAAAGIVGEIITSTVESGSAVSLSNTVISDVTSISLTAGDWDVDGNVGYSTSGATVTQFLQGIATASGTAGPTGSYSKNPMSLSSDSNSWFQDAPTWRVSISSTTTIYLIARSYFSAGTVAAYGFIRARRVR